MSATSGKATIDTNTYGKSTGHSGYSTNYQNTGRELMTPDEVRMLDNRYAILFIRGERPIFRREIRYFKTPQCGTHNDDGMESRICMEAVEAVASHWGRQSGGRVC